MKIKILCLIAYGFSFIPQVSGGNGGNPRISDYKCLYEYNRCSRADLLKMLYPDSPNPDQQLVYFDPHNRKHTFKQLASHVDNDISDFSWDKVLFIGGGSGAYKSGIAWYRNYDISTFQESSHITALEPEKGRFVATTAHWPYGQKPGEGSSSHDYNAALWIIVKSKDLPVPRSWLKNPGADGHKRYIAHMLYGWRRSPPNCPALGGAMRVKNRPDSNECRIHGPRKSESLQDNEGEFHYPPMKGRLWDIVTSTHDYRIPPLQGFLPSGGEVVGFLFSGYHSAMGVHSGYDGERPTIEERTNIVWYRFPSRDGSIQGGVVDCHSDVGAPCVEITASPEECGEEANPCTEEDPENPSGSTTCGKTANTCTSGSFHGHPPDTATEHRWTCRHVEGTPGGIPCNKLRSEDGDDENLGRCGNAADSCSGGDLHSHPPDTNSEIIWTCRNRGETYTLTNGQERHGGEITCALSRSNGTIRAVDNGYTGLN